jgi:hypothetical protein
MPHLRFPEILPLQTTRLGCSYIKNRQFTMFFAENAIYVKTQQQRQQQQCSFIKLEI